MSLDSRLGLARLGFFVLGDLIADGTIYPTGIPSEEAFGVPAVYRAGTIYPISIDSAEAFGAPSFGQSITVSPSSIASAEAFGTPALSFSALSQTVSPSSITSLEAFGTPAVAGPPQTIICTGIVSLEAFGAPTLTNVGAPYDKPRVYFNGAEYQKLRIGTASINSRLQQRSQATFDFIWDYASTPTFPAVGQHVRVTENYRTEFAGYITGVKTSVVPGNANQALMFTVNATDLNGIADRRKVFASYSAGAADVIVKTIMANELSEEGLTTNHVTVTSQTITTVGGGQSLKQVMDSISKDTGGLWFIDEFGDIHLEFPGDGGAAPWNVTDTNDTVRNVTIETNLDTFANTVNVRTNQTLQ